MKYFGTDGFRGEANINLTADHAFRIGRFLGWYYANPLSGRNAPGHKPRVVIGKDTRRSSYMLEYALVAGLTASGAEAFMLHVTTTPSVSYVTRQDDFDCGIMISASHNPYTDNGIKLINGSGEKMDDRTLLLIEDYLDGRYNALGLGSDIPLATGADIGAVVDYAAGRNRYIGYLISLSTKSFKNKRIGLDCANGSAWMIAKSVFDALGAKTYVINASPDGTNINENAGSTHISGLQRFVRENALDCGFAFDGDADRCLAVDENGEVVDGDRILYIFADYLSGAGALEKNTVVTTVMSNMGLYKALKARGFSYETTAVGDRFVYECMARNGYALGGEQSGHIILSKYATTGDGVLTAIKLLEAAVSAKVPLSRLSADVILYPQALRNIRVQDRDASLAHPAVVACRQQIEQELGEEGRILIRKSGTEPVLRIMVEAADRGTCERCVERVCEALRENHLC